MLSSIGIHNYLFIELAREIFLMMDFVSVSNFHLFCLAVKQLLNPQVMNVYRSQHEILNNRDTVSCSLFFVMARNSVI